MDKLRGVFESVVENKIRTIPDKVDLIETARRQGRVLAVRGSFDYVEKVLPHCYAADKVLIEAQQSPPDLAKFDVLFVGCPGSLGLTEWQAPILGFLDAGGVLLTTDWGLTNLIEKVFPKTIAPKGQAQGTFPLRVRNPHHRLLEGISDCGETPWVVETASHRIAILDPTRVEVILDAPQMGDPSAVLVAFEVGQGLVVHAISHFHLQGSEETGEYVSAYLLTNIIDEAMRRKYPPPKVRVVASTPRGVQPKAPGTTAKSRIRIVKSR